MNILISLHKGYGLGDSVQISAVLRHVKKYRPHWVVDYQAEEGRHQVGRGIVANTFAYGEKYPHERYDGEVLIALYDTWAGWTDKPNTRVSSCLHEKFGLEWDQDCGRYEVNVSDEVRREVRLTMQSGHAMRSVGRSKFVAVHYQGDTAKDKKDLSHTQMHEVCKHISSLNRIPLVIDWRDKGPLASIPGIYTTGRQSFSQKWGTNAEYNCAMISQCEAFVGIDSGPGKCASATDTPSLIVWTGHHPAAYHDPAPNTWHLVPLGFHSKSPMSNNRDVIRWFDENYQVRYYVDDPVYGIKSWLKEVLK